MPNVTVQLSQDAYRKARVWCAENDTNLSRVVRHFLESLSRVSASKLEQLRAAQSATQAGSAIQSTPAGAVKSPPPAAPAPQPPASPSPEPKKSQNPSRTAKLQNSKSSSNRPKAKN